MGLASFWSRMVALANEVLAAQISSSSWKVITSADTKYCDKFCADNMLYKWP